jgi:hypothetical protein
LLQLDTSQVVISKVAGKDGGTAVEFYVIFRVAAKADRFVDAFRSAWPAGARCVSCDVRCALFNACFFAAGRTEPEEVKKVFAGSALLNKNPRVIQEAQQTPRPPPPRAHP